MTDNDIIKALECCLTYDCDNCPFNPFNCDPNLQEYAIGIINRQKAEIERLQKENNQFADIGKLYSEIKADAIKEFAERLKEEIDIRPTHSNEQNKYVFFLIDNLVKEMVGES